MNQNIVLGVSFFLLLVLKIVVVISSKNYCRTFKLKQHKIILFKAIFCVEIECEQPVI